MPRSMAVRSWWCTIIGSTTATFGFTVNPAGTHSAEFSTR
jgi:hypothetical protein